MKKSVFFQILKYSFSLFVVSGFLWIYVLFRPLKVVNEVLIIPQGSSLQYIARLCADMKIIPFPAFMTIPVRVFGLQKKIKFGHYEITHHMTPGVLFKNVLKGKQKLYAFTILPGWTKLDLFYAFKKHGALLQADLSGYPEKWSSISEASFLPETYFFSASKKESDILKIAQKKLEFHLWTNWFSRDEDLAIQTPQEALILASILEKEAHTIDDLSKISGVFQNRLRKKMPLQADSTVRYAFNIMKRVPLNFKDLKSYHPYNTYKNLGLPPGPICTPSISALKAALHPVKSDYLYFVLRKAGSLEHGFSDSFMEHVKLAKQYRDSKKKAKE